MKKKIADIEEYNRFIGSLEIINVIFPDVKWKLQKRPEENQRAKHELKIKNLKYYWGDKKEKILVLPAKLLIKGYLDDEEKPYLSIDMRQELVLRVNPELVSDIMIDLYIKRNAMMTLIAAFREQVKYVSFQMGLPPLVLPVFKIAPAKKSGKSSDQRQKPSLKKK